MNRILRRLSLCALLLASFCAPTRPSDSPLVATHSPSPSATSGPPALWISNAVPDALRDLSARWDLPLASTRESATLSLDVQAQPAESASSMAGSEGLKASWIYALVAPFPTVADGVSLDELRGAWAGNARGVFADQPLRMTETTLGALSMQWGEPAAGAVMILPADDLLDAAWESMPSWAIVPFEELQPRWKVLAVDMQSPVRKDFDAALYPLQVEFSLTSSVPNVLETVNESWPDSNRDASKLTTLILTGVTALVRFTAITMNTKGALYPGRDIRDLLRQADITHISNEIPFWGGCVPSRGTALIFCSDPRYLELLEDIGADLIELSGDHFGDYGPDATRLTIEMYEERGLQYYGGGLDIEDARQPRLLENHGNKLAFLGCNAKGSGGALAYATAKKPGAFPCDFKYMTQQITELTRQGYLVISTFQWHESQTYSPLPFVTQIEDFHRMAAAGAVIVSGSQAHAPQAMEFYGSSFIHYGLGNLFFDQMGDLTGQPEAVRNEFIDQYTLYQGRLLSIELFTTKLEDYSRPRPMTDPERSAFLSDMFFQSGWIPLTPTATPQPTLTLTPINLPEPAATLMP